MQFALVVIALTGALPPGVVEEESRLDGAPMGPPGLRATYRHVAEEDLPGSVVETLTLTSGPVETGGETEHQWLRLEAEKANGEPFRVWLLGASYPPPTLSAARETISRYLLQDGQGAPLEFRDQFTGRVVLPGLGGWTHLFPRSVTDSTPGEIYPVEVRYLGHVYRRQSLDRMDTPFEAPGGEVIELLPDVLIGLPHNTKQKDETRRYDGSDYELVRLTRNDYEEMIHAGMTCLRVDAEQVPWVRRRNVFYWGVGGGDVRYPECLYRSNYLGPSLFLDEPAVVTRDRVLRPRLRVDEAFRKALTPEIALEAFRRHFHEAKYRGAPTHLLSELAARPDVNVGEMDFLQRNLYTWETMVASAGHQLGEGTAPPVAMVWEPPGRVGTRRTLPEMNMTYGCQIPADDPKNLTSIIYGFLRGAARLTDRDWGMSIYGAVDRTDAFWLQTHAYDLGARFFFFWDSYQLACVPFGECLALSRNLRAHAESHPQRDLARLKWAAEVLILLPAGYNLGHVAMGKGSLWGLGELNLERLNRAGVKYRVVMGNLFTEIERCLRLGVAYDLLWDLEELRARGYRGYREVVRIREDGKVQVETGGQRSLLDRARTPPRPAGEAPRLAVELSPPTGPAPLAVSARALITEGSAPIYYTLGADRGGIYRNVMAAWELYGPEEEDYRFLRTEGDRPLIRGGGSTRTLEIGFTIERPGSYRLRVSTVDLAGRTAVTWKELTVGAR